MRTFGLLGYPLSHSFSKTYFREKFDREQITDAEYVNFEEADLHMFLSKASKREDLKGFNVTIPYKEGILPFLDSISDEASWVGAINTVKRVDNKLIGYNTDVIGFRESILPLLNSSHRKALILGTGGASKAVKYVFDEQQIASLFISRHKERGHLVYEQLTPELLGNYTIIVNTTPLGTYPKEDEAPLIPYEALSPDHVVFDLVYNPAKTKFLQAAEAQGAAIKNGYEMLELQAEASWAIWNE